jgi:surface antigen
VSATWSLRSRRTVAAAVTALALVVSLLGVDAAVPAASGAAVSGSQHEVPYHGAPGVTFLCGPDGAYGCTPGYQGTNVPSKAWQAYGCPNASGCPATPHNCTLYAAFRLNQAGVVPSWTADASSWANQAAVRGVAVNQTPAVGSIAEWNLGKGHVAYVEGFDANGIILSMDWWSSPTATPGWPKGYTSVVYIAKNSAAWPDNFIHFRDVIGSYAVSFTSSEYDSLTKAADYFGVRRSDVLVYGVQVLLFIDAATRSSGGLHVTAPTPSGGSRSRVANYYDTARLNEVRQLAQRTGVTTQQLHDIGADVLIYLWWVNTH